MAQAKAETTESLISFRYWTPCDKGEERRGEEREGEGTRLGDIDEHVGAVALRTEGPDLAGIGDVPAPVVGEGAGELLLIVAGVDLTLIDGLSEALGEGLGGHVETVVLVGRLGEADLGGGANDGLTVGDDGVGGAELNTTAVLLLEILEADLKMELTGAGDDVLTGLLNSALHEGIGLGEALEALDELGEVGGVLGLDGDAHDGRDGELEHTDVVGDLGVGDGTRLEEVLVDTDETDGVTAGDVLDGLDVAAHHEHGALDVLDEEIVLLASDVVGAHDADLLAGADGAGEDTTEGVEAALVGGGDHLGDVEHEGAVGVALADGDGALVVLGTLVEVLDTVALGDDGRGELGDDHLEESLVRGEELAHDNLEEGLALEVTLLTLEDDVERLEHLLVLLLVVGEDGLEEAVDGVKHELAEGALDGGAVGSLVLLDPALGAGVEVVVAPELAHHALAVDTELLGVHVGEAGEGETPAVEAGTEGDGTLGGVDLDITEELILVGGDDDVGGLNGAGEGLNGVR